MASNAFDINLVVFINYWCTEVKTEADSSDEREADKSATFTVLLHGSLKVEQMVALVQIGFVLHLALDSLRLKRTHRALFNSYRGFCLFMSSSSSINLHTQGCQHIFLHRGGSYRCLAKVCKNTGIGGVHIYPTISTAAGFFYFYCFSPILVAIFQWTWVNPCLLKQRMTEAVVTTEAINHAKLQSDHHQHPVFLQTGCPSCRPTNNVRALKWIFFTVCVLFIFFCITIQLPNLWSEC